MDLFSKTAAPQNTPNEYVALHRCIINMQSKLDSYGDLLKKHNKNAYKLAKELKGKLNELRYETLANVRTYKGFEEFAKTMTKKDFDYANFEVGQEFEDENGRGFEIINARFKPDRKGDIDTYFTVSYKTEDGKDGQDVIPANQLKNWFTQG